MPSAVAPLGSVFVVLFLSCLVPTSSLLSRPDLSLPSLVLSCGWIYTEPRLFCIHSLSLLIERYFLTTWPPTTAAADANLKTQSAAPTFPSPSSRARFTTPANKVRPDETRTGLLSVQLLSLQHPAAAVELETVAGAPGYIFWRV